MSKTLELLNKLREAMKNQEINWAEFNTYPEMTITCSCVFSTLQDGDMVPTYRSHAKVRNGRIHVRKPCPKCGCDDKIFSVSSDPEYYSIK
jgi:hypothetical protein